MRIDATHRKWLIASLIILGVTTFVYIAYAAVSPSGPSGGSAMGLTFGIIGSAFMIFAGLLAGRKKVAIWRLGRAQTWMRGHLWLGALSLPIIFFHAGFHFGGTLTSVLMILLIIVVASGIFGAALQHYMPRMMTVEIPMETVFEQIDRVRGQLLGEADAIVATACGSLDSGDVAFADVVGGRPLSASSTPADLIPLRDFYTRQMRPFLLHERLPDRPLATREKALGMFERLRALLPETARETTKSLEAICEEERQLRHQTRMHHWLHGWLMLHAPLSLALLLLGCIHAVMSLRY